MLHPKSLRLGSSRRPGKILALFALLLPALIGMAGLTVDVGLLLAAHRQTQNAADAAALAAAMDLLNGSSEGSTTAMTYVQQHHGLTRATVIVNQPPSQGPYMGDVRYVEVIVTSPCDSWFIQVLGTSGTEMVVGRAVAGYERVAAPQTVLALDPEAYPGLTVDGATLQVNGRVWVNSQGAGYDEEGGLVDLSCPAHAVSTDNGGLLRASEVQVVGGVSDPGTVLANSIGGASPLKARALLLSDPLLYLPTPTTANGVTETYPDANGQTHSTPQHIAISLKEGQSVTLSPGIYRSITITGSGPGTVTFNPGIYVLAGGNTNGQALHIATGGSVTGDGVMFYNTGSDYDPVAGSPDRSDGNGLGSAGGTFGAIDISTAPVTLTPLNDSGSPFDGMLLYQRRWNTKPVILRGNGDQDQVTGTLYARWAEGSLIGTGAYSGQFFFGRLSATGSTAMVTLNYGSKVGRGNQVFLVE